MSQFRRSKVGNSGALSFLLGFAVVLVTDSTVLVCPLTVDSGISSGGFIFPKTTGQFFCLSNMYVNAFVQEYLDIAFSQSSK